MPSTVVPAVRPGIPIRILGISLSGFLAFSFVLCVLLSLIV
jgi:hypothetical protein